MEQYVFLLGGMDLEMLTIEEILKALGVEFYNLNLSWNNALLSNYADVIERYVDYEDVTLVGVELQEDIQPPTYYNYICIDHHNAKADLPASISQVANLLGYSLTRRQQLIAANDVGYIPAMETLGATAEEIADIRLADRKAQGVTDEEEQIAAAEVQLATDVKGVTVVRTSLHHFSPLVDRVYPYQQLLVVSPVEIVYYGDKVDVLVDTFADPMSADQYYYGQSYFGLIVDGVVDKIVNQIIDLL